MRVEGRRRARCPQRRRAASHRKNASKTTATEAEAARTTSAIATRPNVEAAARSPGPSSATHPTNCAPICSARHILYTMLYVYEYIHYTGTVQIYVHNMCSYAYRQLRLEQTSAIYGNILRLQPRSNEDDKIEHEAAGDSRASVT